MFKSAPKDINHRSIEQSTTPLEDRESTPVRPPGLTIDTVELDGTPP